MREASDIRSEIAMTTTAVAALSEELRDGWGNEGGVGEEDGREGEGGRGATRKGGEAANRQTVFAVL